MKRTLLCAVALSALTIAVPSTTSAQQAQSGSNSTANSGSMSGAANETNNSANNNVGTSQSESNSASGAVSGSNSASSAQGNTQGQGQAQEANNRQGQAQGQEANNDQQQGQGQSQGQSANNSQGQSANNTQGQSANNSQGQMQGQNASQANGQSTEITFNTTQRKTTEVRTNNAVPLAASSSFSTDYCGGTVSGGASASPIGISIGGAAPKFDKTCQALRRAEKFGMAAANAHNMQQPELAGKLMSMMIWSICTADGAGPSIEQSTAQACAMAGLMGQTAMAGNKASPPSPPPAKAREAKVSKDGQVSAEAAHRAATLADFSNHSKYAAKPISAEAAAPR